MTLTAAQLRSIAGPKAAAFITAGIVANLDWIDRFGIDRPHRLAHFLCQLGHESDRFHTTTEYASGSAYEGRRDLGNTQRGDGKRFRGRGLIQCTGRANAREFTAWMRAIDPACPDFESDAELLAAFPWALYSAVWYWETRKLSAYADQNNIEMITRRINGGLNGYEDRIALYTRTALVLLGYPMTAGVVKRFQVDAGLAADDVPGPKTRAALHARLKAI